MSRFIAIANQKGGVGKTTSTVNLAASLARFGKRVLVLDMDPQGNASSGLGVAANAVHRGIYEVLMGSLSAEEAITRQASPGVDLLPSGQRLIGAEVELVSALARERILEKAIQPIRDSYDILMADCPPSLGLLTVNTLTAADTVLIPMQCEYYALEGLTQLLNTIKLIQQALNPRLEIEGILLTMFDARLNLSHEVAEETRKFFPGRVYETIIPRNVRLSEAPSFGKPVLEYDPECAGAQFYLKLAREVLKLPEGAMPLSPAAEAQEHEAHVLEAVQAVGTEDGVTSTPVEAEPGQAFEVEIETPAMTVEMDRDAQEVADIAAQLADAEPVVDGQEEVVSELPESQDVEAQDEEQVEVAEITTVQPAPYIEEWESEQVQSPQAYHTESREALRVETEVQATEVYEAPHVETEVYEAPRVETEVQATDVQTEYSISATPAEVAVSGEAPVAIEVEAADVHEPAIEPEAADVHEPAIEPAHEATTGDIPQVIAIANEAPIAHEPPIAHELHIANEAHPVTLSADDLAEDVLTLPEESIVQHGQDTQYDNGFQPMTGQDAHHPQEELVSHD